MAGIGIGLPAAAASAAGGIVWSAMFDKMISIFGTMETAVLTKIASIHMVVNLCRRL